MIQKRHMNTRIEIYFQDDFYDLSWGNSHPLARSASVALSKSLYDFQEED